MKFRKEILQELTYGEGEDAYNVISNEVTDNNRWSIISKMIFQYQDKFYETRYSRGATEMQDEQPYQYDGDMIECEEVFPVEKTIIVYERKK